MREIHINISKVIMLSYLYLALPVFIFFFGWLKPGLALFFSVFLFAALFYGFRELANGQNEKALKIPIGGLFVIVGVLLIWIFMSGIGGLTWQREDWHARNALLHDLIDNRWPVIFQDGSGLTYYVCYWMIPAIVGKMVGWNGANVTLVIWTFIGLLLVSFLLFDLFKNSENSITISKLGIIMLFFILWGGLNIIGQFIVFLKGKGTMSLDSIYGWSPYQYTPNNALMEWVFNQTVPAWIGAMLFLYERKTENVSRYGFLIMLILPFTPFAALGAIPLFIVDMLKKKCKGIWGISNVTSVIAILPVFGTYFFSNNAFNSENTIPVIGLYRLSGKSLLYNFVVYAVFIFVEIGLYTIFTWKENRQDYFYRAVVIWLFIIPLIRVGTSDKRMFLMRGSIIPLFLMMIYVMKTLFIDEFRKKKAVFYALLISIVVGFYSGAGDLMLTVLNTGNPEISNVADRVKSMNNFDDEEWNAYMANASYVVKNAEDTIFFGKLAK